MASTNGEVQNVTPVSVMFQYLQTRTRVQILCQGATRRIEGYIIGFDEHMNIVLDDAEKVNVETKDREKIGRIILTTNNVVSICSAD